MHTLNFLESTISSTNQYKPTYLNFIIATTNYYLNDMMNSYYYKSTQYISLKDAMANELKKFNGRLINDDTIIFDDRIDAMAFILRYANS